MNTINIPAKWALAGLFIVIMAFNFLINNPYFWFWLASKF